MMVRLNDNEKRRNEVLVSTIELYLATAVPVGSSSLCRKRGFDFSSATTRNILAELEEMELLTHPHTSAGRVPTDKGYRYYLDILMGQEDFNEAEKGWIRNVYQAQIKKAEDVLDEASRVIALLTHYAGIVSFHIGEDKVSYSGLRYIIEQPEFNDLGKIRCLFNLLEEKEGLLWLINKDFAGQVKVYIGKEGELEGLSDCSVVVSRAKKGREDLCRLAVLGPKRMAYRKVIPLIDYLSELVGEIWERF